MVDFHPATLKYIKVKVQVKLSLAKIPNQNKRVVIFIYNKSKYPKRSNNSFYIFMGLTKVLHSMRYTTNQENPLLQLETSQPLSVINRTNRNSVTT